MVDLALLKSLKPDSRMWLRSYWPSEPRTVRPVTVTSL